MLKDYMKSIGNIWDAVADIENIRKAHHYSRRGKSSYKSVKEVNKSEEKHFKHLQYLLKSGKYKTSSYEVEERVCGEKLRVLHKLPYFPDRIAHRAFLNLVAPVWTNHFIRDTFQSIRGRGTSDCMRRVRKGVQEDKPKLARKIDIVKYYPNLTNGITLNPKLYRLRDNKASDFLYELIGSLPFLPLGNSPSQFIGNLAVSELDWKCKQELGIKNYYRYCDDIVIMGDTDSELDKWTAYIVDWLANINLECRYSDLINLETNYLDFVGFRFKHDKILLRKRIVENFKSNIKQRNLPSISAYYGWCKAANAIKLYNKHTNKFLGA